MKYRSIQERLVTTAPTISRWKERFLQQRVEGLIEIRHPGQKPSVDYAALEAKVFEATRRKPKDGSTHWSCRKQAAQLGVSKDTVQRVWHRAGLKAHRLERCLGNDDPESGKNRFITVAARRYFGFSLLQAAVSKADARNLSDGTPIPEVPRIIVSVLGTVNRLCRHKLNMITWERNRLETGTQAKPWRNFRGAVVRSFLDGRMDLGVNFLVASGNTGQTMEMIALPAEGQAFERAGGIRLPSYVSASYTLHFGR